MNTCVLLDQTLLRCFPKERAVIDLALLCHAHRRVSLFHGRPGVEVSIEVDDGDGAVDLVQRAKDGEDNGMVSAQGDDARMRDFVLRE